MAKIRAFWPILRIPDSAKLQIFVIFDHFGFSESSKLAKNEGVLAYFADSGQRKIADFRDFGPESANMAKIRAFWPILRIPDSAKFQIFVILDHFGLPRIRQNGENKGLLAYFADSGQRKIADFPDF